MGATAAIAAVVGTGVSAYGQYQSGQYNKAIAGANARIQQQQSVDALERGAETERRHRLKTRQIIGSQRAALAASGVDVNSGSALDVQQSTAYMSELDALTIRNNAAREAWGYAAGAANTKAQGEMAAKEGTNKAIGTILTGGADAASYYGKK